MGSLFTGSPQSAPSYATSTTETPKWMQDAIYNQIQLAQNLANTPYQPYSLPSVAGLSPLQQQAYTNIQANQGSWSPQLAAAQTGMQNMVGSNASYTTGQPGLAAQATLLNKLQGNLSDPYNTLNTAVTKATGLSGLTAAQPYMTDSYMKAGEAGNINTATGLSTAQDLASQQGALIKAQPYMTDAYMKAGEAGNIGTSIDLDIAQDKYLNQTLAGDASKFGQALYKKAGLLDAVSAAEPYLTDADTQTAAGVAEKAYSKTEPYLTEAKKASYTDIAKYMSPYQTGVMDVIAKQGARNLSENLLPAVSDQFIRAGQFGGSRMGEFGSRALRDTQESVLNQQAQLANQGYGQALGASQADLARQAQLAGTVGSIYGADLSRLLQGGAQYGNLGQTAAQITSGQMQNLTNVGQAQTAAGQAQQQFGLNAAQSIQGAEAQDAARKLQSAGQISSIGQNIGQMQGQQQQAMLSSAQAYQAAQAQDAARKLQASGQISSIGQNIGNLTQAQQQMLLSGGQALSGAQQQAISQGLSAAGQYGTLGATAGQLASTDAARQMSALNQMASMAQQRQGMQTADAASLEAAGASQQAQQQAQLNAAYQQYQQQQMYPKQQADFLSTQIRGMAPITPQTTNTSGSTTTFAPSPLSQLATGLYAYKGLNALGQPTP